MKYSEQQYSEARRLFSEAKYDEALECLEDCITILRKATIFMKKREGPDFKRYIDAKMLQGRIYDTIGMEEESRQVLDQLRKLSLGADDSTGTFLQAKLSYFSFEMEYSQNNTEKAFQHLFEAKDQFIASGDLTSAIDVLFEMEQYPELIEDQEKVLDMYREILSLKNKLDDKNVKKTISGRTLLQIAKVMKRTDFKKSKKSLVLAYQELVQSDRIYNDSLLSVGELQIHDDPSKSLELAQKVSSEAKLTEHKLRAKLIEGVCMLLLDHELPTDFQDQIKTLMKDVKFDLELADTTLEYLRFQVLYGKDKPETLNSLIEYTKNTYSQFNDKRGKVLAFLMEALLSDDPETKLSLVRVYAKSVDTSRTEYLRPITFDLIKWIIHSEEVDYIDQVKKFYSNPLLQAETLKLLSKFASPNESLESEAEKLFLKTHMKSHPAIIAN